MDELTLLANALMALDDKLAACMKCGMCHVPKKHFIQLLHKRLK